MKKVTDLTIAVNLNAKRSPFSEPFVPKQQHVSMDQASQRGVHRAINRFIDRWKKEDELEHTSISQFSTLELLNRSIETMQNTIAHMKLSANLPDILVEIPYDCGGLFDYHLADMIIERGYQVCLEALKRYESAGSQLPENTEQLVPIIPPDES
jgi:NTE family protein